MVLKPLARGGFSDSRPDSLLPSLSTRKSDRRRIIENESKNGNYAAPWAINTTRLAQIYAIRLGAANRYFSGRLRGRASRIGGTFLRPAGKNAWRSARFAPSGRWQQAF